jgi:hypothetical protein
VCLIIFLCTSRSAGAEIPEPLGKLIRQTCLDCHNGDSAEGGLDLASLAFTLDDRELRDRWILIHDRIHAGEMPPDPNGLSEPGRQTLLKTLNDAIVKADRADVIANGRGPLRRLTREEYEQNLRDVLELPPLDIRDMLPEDREAHRFNKTATALDMSRVQLAAYLDAAEAALQQAMADGPKPPQVTKYRAVGTKLFTPKNTYGGRKAMFFAKDNHAVGAKELEALKDDTALELALFRSAHWPYFGYPRGFVAKLPGEYRVRFSARAVLQTGGYQLQSATEPVPMTFRARKPSGPDVSGDVRATGGIMDIQPKPAVYETTVRLLPTETFEYSLLGLPVPLARNVNAARRRIAIHHFLKAASRVLPFSGWKSKARYHRSRGRPLRTECCSMISEPRSLPRIRRKTRGAYCGDSRNSLRASLSRRKHLLGSSSSFSDGSSREARSPKQCSPVTRVSFVPATSSICANRLIQRLAISINMPLPRGCRIF